MTSTSAKARRPSRGRSSSRSPNKKRGASSNGKSPKGRTTNSAVAAGVTGGPSNAGPHVEDKTGSSAKPLESLAAAASYVGVSMLMTLLNKQIISKVKFPGTNFLLFCECLIATLLVYPTLAKKPQVFNLQNLQYLFLCTAAKAGNMYFSFLSMKHTSLPVYNVLKRMSPLVALGLDYFLRKKTYPALAKVGMLCILAGAITTSQGDLDFDMVGYACALCAVAGQSSYLVLCARALDNLPGLSHVDVLFYTGFYNMFLFFPLMLTEVSDIGKFWQATDIPLMWLAFVFALYIFQGTLLNYVTFWCTSVTSPVTTGVCGNIKALLTSAIGVLLFSANLSPLGWAGFALNSAGGFIYSVATARAKMAAKSPDRATKKDT
ncbi:unnamed protein product [Amoebophrya sp. A120]|nr:unnamed protein product [Amoebophrya sp. A120]|eukprot:GSA120T00001400001.1